MKSFFKACVILFVLAAGIIQRANSQSVKLLAADFLNGTLTGAALGGATMAIQNSNDYAPLRMGVGLGILYGIGTGIYDNSIISKGEQFYTSGTFNDGKNSSIIVFLDTIYGAAGGAAVGGAISLIGNEPILDGLQYGSGAGAWLGFGFGLIDAFVLAEGPNQLKASASAINSNKAKGMIELNSASQPISLGLLNPSVIAQKIVNPHAVEIKYTMAMEIINIKVGF